MNHDFIRLTVFALFTVNSFVWSQPNDPNPAFGSVDWHYSPDNKVMEEGHQKIREWRLQVETERMDAVRKLWFRGGFLQAPPNFQDTIPAPVPMGTEHTFANGVIKGKWLLNRVTNTTSGAGYGAGVRLDRTVYDSDNNRIYALTTEKNLVDATLTQLGAWIVRNQTILIEKKGFAGVKSAEGVFRLIGSIDGKFRYSDNRGLTWAESGGGGHDRGAVYWTASMANGNVLSHVRKKVGSTTQDVILRSTDFGKTFQDLKAWPTSESSGIVSTKLYNTDDHCFIVRNRSGGGTWDIFQYEKGVFGLLTSVSASGTPSTITGTFSGGIHIYVGNSSNGGYYSNGGMTWVARSSLKSRIETVHPNQPNLLFSNSATHEYSTDGGISWSSYPSNNNTIGWDPKHLTFYKVGGVWNFVAANDMGLCFNADVLNRSTWKFTNNDHSYAILHGGMAVDNTALTVTANQDPGTFELTRTGIGTYSANNSNSADGLRVAPSNAGAAYWYRHYWEDFMHNHASFTKNTRKATFKMPGEWFTPPFKGSTLPGEDALYVTGQSKLVKLLYNATSNGITRTDLPQDFQSLGGEVTYGIGVAKSDPKRLYVATRNGRFFISTDAGQSWTESGYTGTKPSPQTSPQYNQSTGHSIEVAEQDANLVFWGAGSGSAACLVSRDGGKTFTPVVSGLPSGERLGSISLSPDGKLAFSANFYVYIASENRWHDLKSPSMPTGALPAALGVNYLPLQRKVRYFTWGSGVLDLDITYLNTTDYPAVAFDPTKCYQISAAHSGKTLTVTASSQVNGGTLEQSVWVNAANQKWQLQNLGGYFKIANTETYKTLEVADISYSEGAAIRQWDWSDAYNQRWNVMKDGEGLYAIVAMHSVKAMNVADNSLVDGAKVQQATYFGNASQKWKITETPACNAIGIGDIQNSAKRLIISRQARSGVFQIVHGENKLFSILVFDASGKFLLRADNASTFDLSGQQSGLYYVQIRSEHIMATETITFTR